MAVTSGFWPSILPNVSYFPPYDLNPWRAYAMSGALFYSLLAG